MLAKKQLFCKLWFAGLAFSGLQMGSTNPINLYLGIILNSLFLSMDRVSSPHLLTTAVRSPSVNKFTFSE